MYRQKLSSKGMANTKHYIWSAVDKFGTQIISFVSNILIARILSPDDYGLVAMLAIFTTMVMSLSDAGFNDGLIRKSDCDKKDFGTIASYNLAVALFMLAVMNIAAPYIAIFFGRNELTNIARVLAIGFVLKAITLTGFVQLVKQLKFKQLSQINIICSLLSFVVVYTLAIIGFGYWALALQPVVIAIFNIILLLIIGKWKPYFCFYKKRFKEMFAYSSNLLLSYIINRIGENIYSVIIGKSFSSSSLGFYNQAHKMQTVPSEAIRSIIMTASYPIIANEKNPNKRYDLYLSVFSKFTFIVSAIVFLLMAVSDFAFYALLGEKWIPAAPLFSIFILITLTFPQKVVNANIIKIQGDSALYRNLSLLDTVLRIIALLVTMTYSLEMIVVGQVVAAFISAYTYTACCGKRIGFSTKKQYRIWYSIVWKPLAAFFVSKVILSFFKMGYWGDMFSAVFFLVVLCSLCELTKDHTYINLKTIYITYLKKLCK